MISIVIPLYNERDSLLALHGEIVDLAVRERLDIEIIFVYPWAVIYRQLRAFGLWEMILFAVAVFVSFVYLIGNGALDWGPVRRIRPLAGLPESMRSAERTAETTVRRVDVGRQEPAA